MSKEEMEQLKDELIKHQEVKPRRVEVKLLTSYSFSDEKNLLLTALCHTWLAFFNEYYATFLGFKNIRVVQKKHLLLLHNVFSKGDEIYWDKSELKMLDELIQGTSLPCFKGSSRKISLDPKRIKLLLRYAQIEKTNNTISVNEHLKNTKTTVIYDYKDSVFSMLLEDGFINIFLGMDNADNKKVFYSSFFIMNENDINILIEFFSTAISIFLSEYKQGDDYNLVIRLVK